MCTEKWQDFEEARSWPREVAWQDNDGRCGPFVVSVHAHNGSEPTVQLGYGHCVLHGYEIANRHNKVREFALADVVLLRDLLTSAIDRYREPVPTVVDV
jgi:hypothetical protein